MFWLLRSTLSLRSTPRRHFSFTSLCRIPEIRAQKVPWFTSIPSFREQIARTNELPSFSEKVKCPSVKNQVLFFSFGSFFAFCIAARLTNEETYEWSVRLCESAPAWQYRPPTNDEMRRARYYSLGKTLQQRMALMKDAIEEWPQTFKAMLIWTYIQVAQPILDTSESRRWCWAIGAVNGILFLAWQFPRLRPVMQARFVHSPLSGLSYTMLTSLFSHRNVLHVLVNSMALAAFGSATSQYLFEQQGKDADNLREATPKWHFLAFFISAGLFSNLVSHVAASRITFPRIVSRLRAQAATSGASPSPKPFPGLLSRLLGTMDSSATMPLMLGASGAVYSTLAFVTLAYPDTELALKIPPTFPIPITWATSAIFAVDVVGVWRGWRLFNHWAHLGGWVFGWAYFKYGSTMWGMFKELMLGELPPSLCNLHEEDETNGGNVSAEDTINPHNGNPN